jgi:carbamoyltransferase
MTKKDIWVAGIARGHNSGVCLLKNGKIVFATEEERFTRKKYDGAPLASVMKILDYTDKLDMVGFGHTQPAVTNDPSNAPLEFTGENVHAGWFRKLGLIDDEVYDKTYADDHSQILDFALEHHKLHAYMAFSKSKFDKAAVLVVDGAGSFLPMNNGIESTSVGWEVETIFDADKSRKNTLLTKFKSIGTRDVCMANEFEATPQKYMRREGSTNEHEVFVHDHAGIVKVYEAITQYCGWQPIEAGKTMGLFPYGEPDEKLDTLFMDKKQTDYWPLSDRNKVSPTYPNAAVLNIKLFQDYKDNDVWTYDNPYDSQLCKNLAYKVQTETQEAVLQAIIKSAEMCDTKNVVLTGGYALNCVANYWYLDKLNELGINLYVEPISNDAGTAIGAALFAHQELTEEFVRLDQNIYLGQKYCYSNEQIEKTVNEYNGVLQDATNEDVVELITNKNIVAVFQGGCENGPRALGNRSILYDPTDPDGKDFVNSVKHREYFRPFAGTILKEHVHEWFDLKGMEDTPHMMYAVKCQPGIEEKIPSIIHIDGTCRIQTVTQEENKNYYDLISKFYEKTGCPIIFNTSFNLGGEPLVETLQDAVRTLSKSDIEYLFLPEYNKLIKVENAQEV